MSDSPDLPIETHDDALLRMLQGASFGKDAKLILPSGKVMSGDEAQAFSAAFADADHEMSHRPDSRDSCDDTDNPLSSANDRWTGDQMTDLASLIGRANEAARRKPRRRQPWWKFWN